MHPFGPNSRAIASARIRCAAFVGAKPANHGLPRNADVSPVTTMAPVSELIIAGENRRAKYNNPDRIDLKVPVQNRCDLFR